MSHISSSLTRILCDAAVLDAGKMRWTAAEPTPFTRCAHSGVPVTITSCSSPSDEALSTTSGTDGTHGTATAASHVLIYGGFSGEAVEGDVLQIDCKVWGGVLRICAEVSKVCGGGREVIEGDVLQRSTARYGKGMKGVLGFLTWLNEGKGPPFPRSRQSYGIHDKSGEGKDTPDSDTPGSDSVLPLPWRMCPP